MKLRCLKLNMWLTCNVLMAGVAFYARADFPVSGKPAARNGDEIVAAGQSFHAGTRVVLWTDPYGYEGHNFGMRITGLNPNDKERIRNRGWDLSLLQDAVDQVVYHNEVDWQSRRIFPVLHGVGGVHAHFLVDVDGTIYQLRDLKESVCPATTATGRSVDIEIMNPGTYEAEDEDLLANWYRKGVGDSTRLMIPETYVIRGLRLPEFEAHPVRPDLIYGNVQGLWLVQYDYTAQQYEALIKLSTTLCKVFPRVKCQRPSGAHNALITSSLSDQELRNYHGILAHYHIEGDKVDPGPAFQWDYVIESVRELLYDNPRHPLLSPRQKDIRRRRAL